MGAARVGITRDALQSGESREFSGSGLRARK
jgi:hypothetical protein